MNPSAAGEIADYLKHGDYSVAVRRTLDYCLDTGDDDLIENAVNWSREYHVNENSTSAKPIPDNFISEAESILQQASKIQSGISYQTKPLISAEKISKTYSGGGFSLKPINVAVNTGNVLGVVGENGNGKTTLLRCLAGQLALDNGEIKYHLLERPDAYEIESTRLNSSHLDLSRMPSSA